MVSDELWKVIEPLLPPERPKPRGARPRVDNRAALTGMIFVLKTGMPWELLPQETGCSSGVTCWRRLRDWQEAAVWDRLHRTLLDRLGETDQIDLPRVSLDAASVPAKRGGGDDQTGPNPTDKGYDILRCRQFLGRRGIKCRIARKGIESSERLGGYRWVV